MRRDPCIFEAICKKAMAVKGSTVTIRTKPLGLTGHRARALITYLSELGCLKYRAGRASKMVCPKEVVDKICWGFKHFYVRLKELGLF
jgi:hypothetical protein